MNEFVSCLVLQGTASKESTPSTFTWNSGQACIEIHQMMGFSVWHQRNCTGFLTASCQTFAIQGNKGEALLFPATYTFPCPLWCHSCKMEIITPCCHQKLRKSAKIKGGNGNVTSRLGFKTPLLYFFIFFSHVAVVQVIWVPHVSRRRGSLMSCSGGGNPEKSSELPSCLRSQSTMCCRVIFKLPASLSSMFW